MNDLFEQPRAVEKSDAFERFKRAYPKRSGANPWQPAKLKFDRLVKAGVDPELIIAGARQLSIEEHARGKIGTEFVPMAATWLNQQRYMDSGPITAPTDTAEHWDAILTSFKKFGHWSKWAGPSPDSPACRCPREILAKYGVTL